MSPHASALRAPSNPAPLKETRAYMKKGARKARCEPLCEQPPTEASSAEQDAEPTIAERMAEIMIDRATRGCVMEDFLDDGLSAEEVNANLSQARTLATRRFMRLPDSPGETEAERIDRGGREVLDILPPLNAIVMHLLANGHTKAELDRELPQILARAADDFAAMSDCQSPSKSGHRFCGSGDGHKKTGGGR